MGLAKSDDNSALYRVKYLWLIDLYFFLFTFCSPFPVKKKWRNDLEILKNYFSVR